MDLSKFKKKVKEREEKPRNTNTEHRVVFGLNMRYNRAEREIKFPQEESADKLLKNFNMTDAKA